MENNLSAVLNRQKFEREYIFDGIALLNASFESYVVDVPERKEAEERINARISGQLAQYMKNNAYNLFPEAVRVYKESIANNYPVRPFEAVMKYSAPFNTCGLLSLYYDRYEFTGGAHGNTVRKSDTYNLNNGRVLPLAAFFPRGFDYREYFIGQILTEAKKIMEVNPVFFENYEELIVKNFNPDNYYLTPNGYAIYYQQYEIAPFSTGIVVFEIPYDAVNQILNPFICPQNEGK